MSINPPVRVRRAPDTQAQAHLDVQSVAATLRTKAIMALRQAGPSGLTAEELAGMVGVTRAAIQPRTSELKDAQLIRDSGQRRRNASGKRAIVWVLVQPVATNRLT